MIHVYYTYSDKGPGKVVKNLLKGFDEIGHSYNSNTETSLIKDTDFIVSLQNSVILEDDNLIKRAVIGPNICTLPIDNKVVMEQKYKKILVPSNWVKVKYEKWISKDKIHIWPVGIDTEYFLDKSEFLKTNDCLVLF